MKMEWDNEVVPSPVFNPDNPSTSNSPHIKKNKQSYAESVKKNVINRKKNPTGTNPGIHVLSRSSTEIFYLRYNIRYLLRQKSILLIVLIVKDNQGEAIPRLTSRGVSQGSVLSSLLFLAYTIDIVDILPPHTEQSMYADDLILYSKATNINNGIDIIEEANTCLVTWLEKSHLAINPEKSEFMIFSQSNHHQIQYSMKFGNDHIRRVTSHTSLGIIIDDKITWKPHIDNLITCNKALNIIKATCHKWCGADPACARNLYKALVRSGLEYGGCLISSASDTQWLRIERMQSRALRLTTRAFPSSPIPALLMEAGCLPLRARCMHLANKFTIKKMAFCNHPLISKLQLLLQHLRTPTPYWNNHKVILPVLSLEELSQFKEAIRQDRYPVCYHFNIKAISHIPKIFYCPVDKQTKHIDGIINQSIQEITEQLETPEEIIYTDGSKTIDGVDCAFIATIHKETKRYKLPKDCSIFTAEVVAITSAIYHIQKGNFKNSYIFTDSKSVLQALESNLFTPKSNWILLEIKNRLAKLQAQDKSVNLIWIPSHCNIGFNEAVDQEAKLAIREGEQLPVPFPVTDLYQHLHQRQIIHWEQLWDSNWENIRNSTSLRGPLITP
jgi:ribonuclease HI